MAEKDWSDGVKNGRPFLFTDPKELEQRIQTYFDMCDPHVEKMLVIDSLNRKGEGILGTREVITEQEPYTITGLARALGVSRRTLLDYRKPEHYNDTIDDETRQQLILTIEDAYQRVEEFGEKKLYSNGLANGVKFNLTNNFGWVDKSVVSNINTVVDDLDALDDPKEPDQQQQVAEQAKKALESAHVDTESKGTTTTE